jgi:uncharacterized RDD family membrane protein YckC
VTTPRDDYYDLIGVDPSAPTDEIRERYRERRNELDARGTDEAREEAARLNRAWNVLSDPYQRGRYDESRESAVEEVGADEVEVVEEERPRRRRLFEPPRAGERPARGAREPAPLVEYEGGYHAPENRRRIMAMVIDLFVILVLFVVAQFVLQSVIKERFPAETKLLNDSYTGKYAEQVASIDPNTPARDQGLIDWIDDAKKHESNLSDAADKAKPADKKAAEAKAQSAHELRTNLEDEAVEVQKKFTGTYYAVVAGFVLVALAYLVVPSALTGQTLGKRLQKIRAIRADGSPLRWLGALARYGPLVIITGIFLPTPVGQIVFIIGIVVVLGWMRNPNRQGWHDRLAKTIVVDASA